jgi:hypothetical protein
MGAVAFMAMLGVWPAGADDHLVSAAAQQQRLAQQAGARAADVAFLEDALSAPVARRTAEALGANVDHVRAALPALSDVELRGLAERARALRSDPAAGLDHDIHDLLVILIIVAIVVVVLKAVD